MADPSNEVVEVLIQCMDWNNSTRQSRIALSDLPELQQKAVDQLDILQRYLPDKTGEKSKWNFEKAHTQGQQNCAVGPSSRGMYKYILVCTSTYYHNLNVLVCTSMY